MTNKFTNSIVEELAEKSLLDVIYNMVYDDGQTFDGSDELYEQEWDRKHNGTNNI